MGHDSQKAPEVIKAELGIKSSCSAGCFCAPRVSHVPPDAAARTKAWPQTLPSCRASDTRQGPPRCAQNSPTLWSTRAQADTPHDTEWDPLSSSPAPGPGGHTACLVLSPPAPPARTAPAARTPQPPLQNSTELGSSMLCLKRALNFSFLNAGTLLSSSFAQTPWWRWMGAQNTVIRKIKPGLVIFLYHKEQSALRVMSSTPPG